MLLALRAALAAADDGTVRLTDLAQQVDADPAVVRAALTHAAARGWLPDVRITGEPTEGGAGPGAGCGALGCRPEPAHAACRRCPLAG
jgi:hypothetical protein